MQHTACDFFVPDFVQLQTIVFRFTYAIACTNISLIFILNGILLHRYCCRSLHKSCPTLWNSKDCSTPHSSVFHFPPEFAQKKCPLPVMPSNHLILCCLLLLRSIFPSIRVFSSESVLHIKWPKYWSFSFTVCPSNEYSGLISFRIDWFDLLEVQGTLESSPVPQFEASILQCSAFFMVQFSHPYMTTGKNQALSIQTFLGKVMSLLFSMLSMFVIAFLPRSNHLLISWLQSPSALILQDVLCI